jgi:glutamate N-acetyltransferase/amino-acid N-acetyltransferase
MAKGSGMIEPNMATMICMVTTDAAISPERCDEALRSCCRTTLNALTIDGEMSTNDCVFLLANGASGMPMITEPDEHYDRFCTLLQEVLAELTRKIAMDGEGATRAISVTVQNARTTDQAEQAARAVANSLLVKTAVYGKDPNWGRVISAVGASGVSLNSKALSVQFAGIPVVLGGAACSYSRDQMDQALKAETITITVELGSGTASARIWTCDLTHDYITINAEYTT